jgi:uncharacterized membrane protein
MVGKRLTSDFPVNAPLVSPTTAQLYREITNLHQLIDIRLDAMDKAVVLFNENLTRVPTDTDKQITHLREFLVSELSKVADVHNEKFTSVEAQFVERDMRRNQSAMDSKTAIDAALQAAKEAVGKSEISTTKQIDQQSSLIHTTSQGLNDKIDDIKSRLTLIEGKGVGGDRSAQWVFSAVTIFISVLAIIAAIGVALYSSHSDHSATPIVQYAPVGPVSPPPIKELSK